MTDFAFGEPEEITIADLRAGDFVVEIPTQMGVRGYSVRSGVKRIVRSIDPEWARGWGEWRERRPGYRVRLTVPSSMITFLTGSVGLHYPDDFRLTVRRMQEV